MPITVAPSTLMLTLLGSASLILYFAGRVVMGAIPARIDGATTRSYLAAMPVAIVSVIAVAMDRPLVGLHLPIACAMAALTFGLGAVLIGRLGPKEPVGSRSWALVLPAVAIVLIGAMGGAFAPYVIGALALFGLLALAGWRPDPRPEASEVGGTRREARMAVVTWLVSAAATGVAGMMAMAGLPALESLRQMPSDALATAFLLAPAIVVPMVFELLPPCRSIGRNGSISSLARFAVLCLCLALPLAMLVSAARPTLATYVVASQVKRISTPPTTVVSGPTLLPTTTTATTTNGATMPATTRSATTAPADVTIGPWKYPSLPSVPQRADLLVLAGASLLLLPLSLGGLRAGSAEAVALLACYVFDLVLTMFMVLR